MNVVHFVWFSSPWVSRRLDLWELLHPWQSFHSIFLISGRTQCLLDWCNWLGAALEINRRWFTCRNNPRRASLHRRPVQETLTKCICGIGTCHVQLNLSRHTLVLLWLWPSNDHLWTYVGVAPTLGRRPRGGFNALVLFPAFSNNCWPSFTNQDGVIYEDFCLCWWWLMVHLMRYLSAEGTSGIRSFRAITVTAITFSKRMTKSSLANQMCQNLMLGE